MARCGRRVGATPRSRQITGTAFRRMEWPRRAPYPFIAYSGFRGDAEARSAPSQGGGHRSLPVLGPRHPRRGDGHGGGFTAKEIAVGVDILCTMFRNRSCTTFLSFPAALMATGVRCILRGLVE